MTIYTFSMIKPDATKRKIVGQIIDKIERAGFEILKQELTQLSKHKAEEFYDIHKDKGFFNEMIEEIISGPVIVQLLKKESAVDEYRRLIGSTNPQEALEETIRKQFGLSIGQNSVHGSDSNENAKREILFFFPDALDD